MSTQSVTVQAAMESRKRSHGLFCADRIAPVVNVKMSPLPGEAYKFTYYKIGAIDFGGSGDESLARAQGGRPSVARPSFSDETGTAKEYSREVRIDMNVARSLGAKGLRNWEREYAAPRLMMDLGTDREKRALALLSGFSNTRTGAANGYWDSDDTNPLDHIDWAFAKVITATGYAPNKLVLSWVDMISLRRNPFIRSVFGDTRTVVTSAELQGVVRDEILGSSPDLAREVGSDFEVIVPIGTRRTSTEGQTETYDWTVDQASALMYVPSPENASLFNLSALYTFQDQPYQVRSYNDEQTKELVYEASRIEGVTEVTDGAGVYFNGVTQSPVDA